MFFYIVVYMTWALLLFNTGKQFNSNGAKRMAAIAVGMAAFHFTLALFEGDISYFSYILAAFNGVIICIYCWPKSDEKTATTHKKEEK